MAQMVHVAIGGNVGDVEQNLAEAVRMIDALEGVAVTAVSPLYRTAPVGGPLNEDGTPAQPDFLNGAIGLETTLSPRELMETLLEIELELGRRRLVTDGPRTVEVNVLSLDEASWNFYFDVLVRRRHRACSYELRALRLTFVDLA